MTDQATDDGTSRPRKGRKTERATRVLSAEDGSMTSVDANDPAVQAAETVSATPASATPASATVVLGTPVVTETPALIAVEPTTAPASAEPEAAGPVQHDARPADTAAKNQKNTDNKGYMTMDKAMKTAEEMMAFSQGNVEALVKSSQIWAAGVQDLTKHIAAVAQAQMDETMANVKAMTSVKSIKEAIDMQTSLAKTAMEKALAETGKITDATMKLTEETMAPITARVSIATETLSRTA